MAAPRLRPHQTRRAASNLIRRWAHEGKHALTALDDPTKQRLMRCVTWAFLLVVVPKKGEQKAAKSGGCSQLNIFHFVDSFVHFVTFQRPFWTFIWMTYDENLSFFGLG